MHVLLVSRSFPHHRTGGLEWHSQDVVEGLMAAGHMVSVLTTPLPKEPALRPLTVNGTLIEMGSAPGRYGWRFPYQFAREAKRRVEAIRPDIIHAQGFTGILCERFLRGVAPICTTIHGTLWSETPLRDGTSMGTRLTLRQRIKTALRYRHRYMTYPFWRWFISKRPALIVDSRFTARELRAETGANLDHVTVVPLGFDLSRFPLCDRQKLREKWNIGKEELLLLAVSRLEPTKRPRLLAESFLAVAAKTDKKLRLVIVGEGKEEARLRRIARRSNNLSLAGRLSADQVSELLQAADLFLNADAGAPAFGLSNAEALCMGTPVLASQAGAHNEVILGDDDGRLVEEGESWPDSLRSLLDRLPEGDDQRGRRATDNRLRFDRSVMINRLVRVYTRLQKKEGD